MPRANKNIAYVIKFWLKFNYVLVQESKTNTANVYITAK